MVDWSKISAGLADRIKDIITSEGEDRETAKLDKHAEYQKLSQLLSGDGKVSGEEKGFVEGMLNDYEEAYMVRSEVRERVLDIIKHGEKMQADDKAEIAELKKYASTNGLTKEEKKWIKDVINGRVVKDLPAEKELPDENKKDEILKKFPELDNEKKLPDENKKDEILKKFPELDNEKKQPGENKKDEILKKFPELEESTKSPEKDYPKKGEAHPPKDGPRPNPRPNPTPVPTPAPVPMPVAPAPHVVDNDRVDDKDGVDNKGAFQQGGVGNVNVGPGGTVIINGGAPVGVNPPNGGHGENIPNPDVPVDKGVGSDSVKPTKPSVEETKEARENGEKVGVLLIGHTSNTKQARVQDIINKEINSGNVLEFLRGYETQLKKEKTDDIWLGPITEAAIPEDHFFEQMRTENNFPEQQDLMRKVAEDLQGYLANKYGVDSDVAREVAIILLEQTLGKEQANALDKIYQEELDKR